jgi:CDP-diacylglycerol--glycerol-3-phosphate 3-phosphatidyltransferase
VDRFYLLAPALALLVTMVVALVIYAGLCALGHPPKVVAAKHNQLFGPFFGRYLVWLLSPLERLLYGRVSPNTVTMLSVLLCGLTGLAAGLGHLAGAVWLYALAGFLDALDGRLARLAGTQTTAGALFDSVSDRWGELFVFAGYAWFLHDTAWMLAVIGAMGSSLMVSYTRARAEGLGLKSAGGMMQRAERIVLVAIGTLLAAWYWADPDTVDVVAPILGVTMLVCTLTASATALNRAIAAIKELKQRDLDRELDRDLDGRAPIVAVVRPDSEPIPTTEPLVELPLASAQAFSRKVRPLETH